MRVIARVVNKNGLSGYIIRKGDKTDIYTVKAAVMLAKAGLIENGVVVVRRSKGKDFEYVRAMPGCKFGEYELNNK